MINATNETFDSELDGDLPVVVYFWADWCGPCKALAPIFEELATENAGKAKFVKVDTDATSIAAEYSIRGIPTILIFRKGEVVNTIVGAQTKARLQLALDAALA